MIELSSLVASSTTRRFGARFFLSSVGALEKMNKKRMVKSSGLVLLVNSQTRLRDSRQLYQNSVCARGAKIIKRGDMST